MPPREEKAYDRAYFDRWYRNPRWARVGGGVHERRVRLALGVAEYLLERPVETVLDVGCGEAPWRGILRRMRPGLCYVGVDSSEYAVRRYGARRGIRLGTVGTLGTLGLKGKFDLVVCSDVLHYVDTAELRAGVRAIARLLGGVAFLELFAAEDETEGDQQDARARPAALYRRIFREAGLVQVGPHCHVGRALARRLTAFERCGP